MATGVELYVQAIIAVVVIVDPFIRSIFFRTLTENEPERRAEYVRTIMIVVGVTLGVSALAGRELLDLIGINLGAFGVAGGIVLTLMGFEMLLGGEPSRAQGGEEARERKHLSAEDSIIVPYAIPFMCGPGASTTVITLNLSERGIAIMTRFGGLFIATIGVQLVLSGIETFFEG